MGKKKTPQETKRETMGDYLKRTREAQGLTQEVLADLTELHVTSLRNWEQNHRVPQMSALRKLAKFLAVPFDDLADMAEAQTAANKRNSK